MPKSILPLLFFVQRSSMERRDLTKSQAMRGFVFGSLIFFAVFASTAVPIPLYSTFQSQIGLTNADVSYTMLWYLCGVVLTLLLASRLSDAFGRRRVTFLTVALAIVGCLLFLQARDSFMVFAARFVQGVSAGLTMSAVSALVVDCISRYNLSLGSAMASCGSMVGIMMGSIGVGVLFGATHSTQAAFGVMAVILAVSACGLVFVPDPLAVRASKRSVLKVSVFIPHHAKRAFFIANCLYLATWVTGSFFQAFSSPLAVAELHSSSTLLAALVLSAAMAPSMIGGPLTARLTRKHALWVGIALLCASSIGMACTLAAHATAAFLGACALFSVSMGITNSTSLRMLLVAVEPSQTSAIIGSVNLFAYLGCSVFSFLFGPMVGAWGYTGSLWLLAAVNGVLSVAVLAVARPLK
ncbi:MFS transporter [Eggerthellaceae bacterium zg-887]|nr:MFS transporter [Xiamenia xianingshaonis]